MQRRAFIVLLAFWLSVHTSHVAGATHDPALAQQVLAKLQEVDSQFLNVYVHATTIQEEYDASHSAWRHTPNHMEVRAWLNGRPGSLYKFEMVEYILSTVTHEGAPWLAEYKGWQFANDGEQTYVVRREELTDAGTFFDSKMVTITATHNPASLAEEARTAGTIFSNTLFDWHAGEGVSAWVQAIVGYHQGTGPSLATGMIYKQDNGQVVVVARHANSTQERRWVLDAEKDYAYVDYELAYYTADVRTVYVKRQVSSFHRSSDAGLYYPLEATEIINFNVVDPTRSPVRNTYVASQIQLNNPNWTSGTYRPSLPEGFIIDDQIRGVRTRTGPNLEQLDADLQQRVDQALNQR